MTATPGIERQPVNLPPGFDPARHQQKLLEMVTQASGPGWEIDSIDPAAGVAHLSRQVATTEVVKSATQDTFDVRLARGTKPTDGEKAAAKFEDQYPGFTLTKFEPFLGRATLSKLSDDELRCRGAVSVALGVKPWDVQVRANRGGGFTVELPRTYVPSKHDDKLTEVATTAVGRDGWYIDVDVNALTCRIIPSEPPTFPKSFPTPLNRLGKGDLDRTPFGRILPNPGEAEGPEMIIDWTASAFALIAGTPGSGKSVSINALIADALSNGSALVVVDDKSKAVDFEWCKDFVRPGGWGCDDIPQAVAALGLVREEGARRAKKLKELGINNWLDMKPADRFQPILVVVDEVSALVVPEPVPKVPKDHPMYSLALEAIERNVTRAMLQSFMRKIVAELRFVGVRMVLSTQATNANTGVDPGMRTLIGHKILQGVNPSKAARGQIFADESSVPHVPDNVKGGGLVAKGVGVAHLESQSPEIYKSYYASIDDYRAALLKLGVPRNGSAPTAAQIDHFLPTVDEDAPQQRDGGASGGGERAPSGKPAAQVAREMGDTVGMAMHDGSLGTGYERANNMRNLAAGGGQTQKQKAEAKQEAEWAAKSGDVVVKKKPVVGVPVITKSDDF